MSVSTSTLHRWVCDAQMPEQVDPDRRDRTQPQVAVEPGQTPEQTLEDALRRIARLESQLESWGAATPWTAARGSAADSAEPATGPSTESG